MHTFRGATAVEIIAVRLDAGDDVRHCLMQVVQQLQLAAGAVIAGAGTLRHIVLEAPAAESFPAPAYVTEKNGPGQIVAAQGIIGTDGVQISLTIARRNELYCGIAMEGTVVLHSAEFVLLRAGGTRWSFVPGAGTGIPTLQAVLPPGAAAITLMGRPVDVQAVALVPAALIRKHRALPVAKTADTLVVAMPDPNDPFAIDDFRAATGLRIQPVAVPPAELLRAIEQVLVR
jgi:predicted DNA-binding protein with PD1-like motif